MAGLACPSCGSPDFERWRAPKELGAIVFRRHRCSHCRHLFLTAQGVVDMQTAESLLDRIEPPLTYSEPMPSPKDLSLRTLLLPKQHAASPATTAQRASYPTAPIASSPDTS